MRLPQWPHGLEVEREEPSSNRGGGSSDQGYLGRDVIPAACFQGIATVAIKNTASLIERSNAHLLFDMFEMSTQPIATSSTSDFAETTPAYAILQVSARTWREILSLCRTLTAELGPGI